MLRIAPGRRRWIRRARCARNRGSAQPWHVSMPGDHRERTAAGCYPHSADDRMAPNLVPFPVGKVVHLKANDQELSEALELVGSR
jgi:hypothetical protein